MVPHDYLMHFDDFLLPCNNHFNCQTVFEHLFWLLLMIKYRSVKKSHTYNELFLFSSNVISFILKSEEKAKHTTYQVHTPMITTDKLLRMLNQRTFLDISQMSDPYKKNQSDSPITTLTHIIECYDRI